MINDMVGKIRRRFGQGSAQHIQAQRIAVDAGRKYTRLRAVVFLSDLLADGSLWADIYTSRGDLLPRRN